MASVTGWSDIGKGFPDHDGGCGVFRCGIGFRNGFQQFPSDEGSSVSGCEAQQCMTEEPFLIFSPLFTVLLELAP